MGASIEKPLFTIRTYDKTLEVIDFDPALKMIDMRCVGRSGRERPVTFMERVFMMEQMALRYLLTIMNRRGGK